MGEDNHEVGIRLCRRHILPDPVRILQQMHHMGVLRRNRNPIGAVGIVQQREADIVPGNRLIGTLLLFLRRLYPQAQHVPGGEEIPGEAHALRPSVQRVVGGAGHHIEARVHDCLPHLGRGAEPGIVAVPGRIVRKGCLLVNHGHIAFLYGIPYVLKQEIESSILPQAIPVNGLVDQIVPEDHEAYVRLFPGEPPGIPLPAAHLPRRIRQ